MFENTQNQDYTIPRERLFIILDYGLNKSMNKFFKLKSWEVLFFE